MSNALKGFIKACVILLLGVCVLYFVRYNMWKNKEFDYDEDYLKYFNEEEYNQSISSDEIDLDSVEKIYEMINFKKVNETFGSEYFSLYFDDKGLDIDDLSSDFVIYLAIININNNLFLTECNSSREIKMSIIDSKIKDIFGNIDYDKVSFKSKDGMLEFYYDENSDSYVVINKECSGFLFGTSHIETEMFDIKARGNILEVYEYVYYLEYINNSDGSYKMKYYDSLDDSGNVISINEIDDSLKNKFLKYKFTFVKQGEKYLFKKYERLF